MADNPLGKASAYPASYQPELLVSIPRADNRRLLGIDGGQLPFRGADIWNAYEVSCLDKRGKPQVFQGRFIFDAGSQFLVESKSLKLYLNSLNQERLQNAAQLAGTIEHDLAVASGSEVTVMLEPLGQAPQPELPAGQCLDDLDVAIKEYEVNPELLNVDAGVMFEEITEEVLYTNLFRSRCPITTQPDWATVTICYQGRKLPRAALLQYLVSYRQHNDYHENCVERIFCDLQRAFQPQSLTVEANFLRRGGLDINPVRTTQANLQYPAFPRYIRQ